MTLAERSVEPLHRRLGVTDEELDAIRARLGGRDPNDLELAMFSVMWSEHCSYKSSKPLLKTLPTAGEGVVAGPDENAGLISVAIHFSALVPTLCVGTRVGHHLFKGQPSNQRTLACGNSFPLSLPLWRNLADNVQMTKTKHKGKESGDKSPHSKGEFACGRTHEAPPQTKLAGTR